MRLRRWRILHVLGVLCLLPAHLHAQTVLKPAKVPPVADLHRIIERLGDADFAKRTAAQEELKKTATYRDRGQLLAEYSATTDEEVRGRLLDHIVAMELALVSDPPPISVEIKNAEISEVAQVLADALGEEVGWWRPPDPKNPVTGPAPRYTLAMKDKPLWEVIDALAKQHPIALSDIGSFILQENPSYHAMTTTKAGGVGVFLMDSRTAVQYTQFQFAIDPRIKVTKFATPQWSLVTDDLGGTLMTDHGSPDPPWWAADTRGTRVWNSGGPGYSLAKAGAKEIASAKGMVHISMQIGYQSLAIADPQKAIDQPLQIAGKTITIKSFQILNTRLTADIVYSRPAALPNSDAGLDAEKARYIAAGIYPELFEWRNANAVTLRLVDGAGKVVLSYPISRTAQLRQAYPADFKPPLTVEFSSFLEAREQGVPFVLTHIPIPAQEGAARP